MRVWSNSVVFYAFMHVFILESCMFGYFCRSPSVSVVVFASFVFLALPCPALPVFLASVSCLTFNFYLYSIKSSVYHNSVYTLWICFCIRCNITFK